MDVTISRLRDPSARRLVDKGTLWQDSDGDGAYWSSRSGASMAKLAKLRRITIDRARGAPEHGKFYLRGVDGLHAYVKRFGDEVRAALLDLPPMVPVILIIPLLDSS